MENGTLLFHRVLGLAKVLPCQSGIGSFCRQI
jgi:hypothetical protein